MVALVERLSPLEVQEREATDLSVVGLYDILPSNETLLVAIDREEDSERDNFPSFVSYNFSVPSVDLFYRF